MKAESVIHYRLTTFSGTQALVGTRVHPVLLPQEPVYPAIVYKRTESRRTEGEYSDPGMAFVRIQVTCFSKDYVEVKALAEQIRLALERYGSALTGTPINGVTVYDIHMGSEADTYEPGERLEVFAHATDFTVVHAE